MPTYTTKFRPTSAMTGTQVLAANRDAAVVAVVQVGNTGPVGRETHVYTCDYTGATGPTGIYAASFNVTGGVTGSTFSATSYDDAVTQQKAAGPTGPGAGIEIWTAS